MTASALFFYNSFRKAAVDSTFNLAADTLTVILCSSSYAPSPTDTTFANCSAYELPTANGYSQAARKTVVLDGTTATWDLTTNPLSPTIKFPNIAWAASPGTLTAKWAVVLKMAGSNPLVGVINLDNGGASADGITTPGPNSVSATVGNSLTIAWNSGLMKLA